MSHADHNSPYLPLAQAQIPRLLSRMDREALSRTYGSFDRTYWGWKFTDFAGSRFQEAIYALAWMYTTQHDGNELYNSPPVLELISAGFHYWCTLQHRDGSFDEAYPFERSLAATSFTSFYLGEAYLRLGEALPAGRRPDVVDAMRQAGEWLCRNDEHHGVLSNHLAVAAAALVVIARITGETAFNNRAQYFIQRILDKQSDEGWYEEYGGADIGYQTHGTFYLARIWWWNHDQSLLDSLKRSIEFLAHFIHPNGTIGGEYGSRNTSFYFPAGFEILAPVCEQAAAIASFMRRSVVRQDAAGLNMMDAWNFCPMLNNYLFAQDALAENAAQAQNPARTLPFMGRGHWGFPQAGLLVHSTDSYYAVFAPSKGGVLKIYNKVGSHKVFSDCGYWADLADGRRVSSQSFSLKNSAKMDAETASVTASFVQVNQKVMSPWLFIAFRIFTQTLGRHKDIALKVKDLLVNILVRRRQTMDMQLKRDVEFDENRVIIRDTINIGPHMAVKRMFQGGKFSTIHMGSARYFQTDEIDMHHEEIVSGLDRTYTWSSQ